MIDDAQRAADQPDDAHFSRHGISMQPVSSEDAIRQAAASVLPRTPLLGEFDTADDHQTPLSEDDAPDIDINSLTAEDIHEHY